MQKAVLDWSGALFVIEPKSSFSSREEFRSFVSDNVLALFEQPLSAEGASSEHRYQTSVRKNQMLQRVAFEVESAASNYGMHRGHAVKYNDQVQLRHLNSGRYFAIRSRRICNTTPIPHKPTTNPAIQIPNPHHRSSANSAATEFAVVDSVDAVESSLWRFRSSTRDGGTLKCLPRACAVNADGRMCCGVIGGVLTGVCAV